MNLEDRKDTFIKTLNEFCNISEEFVKMYISSDVIDKIFHTNEDFLRCMTNITSTCKTLKHIKFTPSTITTITITGKFVYDETLTKELPIEYIRERLNEENDLGLYIGVQKIKKHRSDVFNKKIQHDKRKFRHQVPIKHDGKSAKLFYNGSVHITGITNLVDFIHITSLIASFIHEITNKELLMILNDFKINMINTSSLVTNLQNFPLSFPPKTITELIRETGQHVDFDPERYPGVKLTITDEHGKKASTGCVFQTGSISLIGSRSPKYIAQTFDVIAKNLDRLWTLGQSAKKPRTTTSRIPLNLAHGYLINSYRLCI
ncbi:transcription factor TFIID (or TATA-binding protein TBP) [Paramecium bursaria Chlorella virus NY2B]|uniref:Transcription factor TFIID (Or TATA-binding protein TBP) n=1 Tax=Paramecium bursaria Chlorella virus NYs1 TaxID=83442 RepID=M1IK33_9PHYC|nr:transcription factor TFIID (or TATA-binding protein TBP) [Paramecium bursaria Chlorella virus NYs1]AGE54376.1 transcription factor TFIID (or TATA-binding protein TBP) [Paramecium bursaria Chlorella virus IL-5-2s1]AGE55059.1 transcription factor TFIID (or TATA-binding protein TBP) [Paramecium bursaria Chlorella virus MA1D]AGE58494.1 transcription factor TFIID (or TATA-binding protein TBP) [Paramecium bursaria Chlorella virus NY2B]AGE58875.1 transcription factor TFIID (or TATA-binding protein 